MTWQTGDELKLRCKCQYVITVEKVLQVGEKVQEEKMPKVNIIHFHLKPVLHDKKKRGQNDITKTDLAPLTRTIYSRMGTTEGFSNTGCGWSSPDLGTSTDAGVVKWLAQPPTGVPFVGAPTLIPPDWDSRGPWGSTPGNL